ncbi:MAG: DUF1565 domain-containing protein [Planctomycetes bacterium]|nr:DUF1565 domain-containing protein [Planctomycetota bacterium]
MSRFLLFLSLILILVVSAGAQRPAATPGVRPVSPAKVNVPEVIHVDATHGEDRNPGTEERPKRSISAAITLLPDPLLRSVTIKLAPGTYTDTGGVEMPPARLHLMHRMRPGVRVDIVGRRDDKGGAAVLAWEGQDLMIDVREGEWRLEDVQIGSGSTSQRRGVMVTGPGLAGLKNVTFRTRSVTDAGIYADRGGKVLLYGAIRLNEHLHEQTGEESFCGIIATDHGLVQFAQREGSSLDMGNGSLSACYYGCIRLGCETARITNWSEQSNNLAINNGGRIDLHNTKLVLRARQKRNTPIGLEHDGHILGEGAQVTIEGNNSMAIALQKASTFTCNDIELRGQFEYCIWAGSGSMFVGRFLTDLGQIEATTGATVNIEAIKGKFAGPAVATRCGTISLPDRNVLSK